MGNKRSATNFPRAPRQQGQRGRYNTPEYFQANQKLGDSNPDRDELNTGKVENYKGDGYYGSNYGSINELNRGRDYEQNAGYRDNYNKLTTGQWPEVERAAQSRGIDLHEQELKSRGIHKGKGPRSYQRSDARIHEDVNDILLEDPYIDATDIEVAVQNGEVILTGTVEDRNIKRRVEDVIQEVSGIKHLENRLRTRWPAGHVVNIQNHQG